MRQAMRGSLYLWLAASASLAPIAVGARAAVTATFPTGPVPLGSLVDLRIRVDVPSGSVIYLPKTLPATDAIESHLPARWTAEPSARGATLNVSYSLITLGIGPIAVPGFDIRVARIDPSARGAPLPGGSRLADRSGAPAAGSTVLAHLPARELRVASLMELEAVLAGAGPTPPSDVLGRNWGIPAIALALAGIASLLGIVLVMVLRWRRRSSGRAVRNTVSGVAYRSAALGELDELFAQGLHRDGSTREFFAQTSRIVRRYVERLDPRWGPHLTSTELMSTLAVSGGRTRAQDLPVEMQSAEFVKFGRAVSSSSAAEDHWRAVRLWIEHSESRAS